MKGTPIVPWEKNMEQMMTLADFKTLTRDKMVEHLRSIDPALVKGKTRAKTEDLVKVYKGVLLEKLNTVAHESGIITGIDFATGPDHTVVSLTIAGEQHHFESYEEALTFLESKRPILGADYGRLETEMLNHMGIGISSDDGKRLLFVVQGKDGDKPQVFEDPHTAIAELVKLGGPSKAATDLVSPTGRIMPPLVTRSALEHAGTAEVVRRMQQGHKPDVILVDEAQHVHVHGPDCGHPELELPVLAGMENFERVNPEMPMMPFQDGAVIEMPAPTDADFVLKSTGEPGELSPKQRVIVERFKKAFETFQKNVEHSGARRDAKAAIYDLKCAGVILHPKFAAELDKGAKLVRDARRNFKLGVDIPKAAQSASEDSKVKAMVEAEQS